MPLAFNSLNQGNIAFGFFNIDTDLLLLEHYFLFADDFCAYLSLLAAHSEKGSFETSWDVHSVRKKVSVRSDREHQTVAVAGYLFTKEVFHQLVEYVWLGGYPRWRDGVRPDYVLDMKKTVERDRGWLFRGLSLQ